MKQTNIRNKAMLQTRRALHSSQYPLLESTIFSAQQVEQQNNKTKHNGYTETTRFPIFSPPFFSSRGTNPTNKENYMNIISRVTSEPDATLSTTIRY